MDFEQLAEAQGHRMRCLLPQAFVNHSYLITGLNYTRMMLSDGFHWPRTFAFSSACYSYCVIEMDKRQGFCAVRCSMDIAPGCLRERRSDVGGPSRSSWRDVVRDGRAAPR